MPDQMPYTSFKFVSLLAHNGELYALREDGTLFKAYLSDYSGLYKSERLGQFAGD